MISFPPCFFSIARAVPLIALLLAVGSPRTPAETVSADDSRITKVTVYRDRAEIVKQSTVRLPAGLSAVRFAGIPYDIDPDTIRVSAEGVPATLGAVEILEMVEKSRETPEWREARDEIRRLEREIETINEDQAVDKQLRAFLTSLGKVSVEQQTRDLHEGRANPQAISGVYELMDSRLRSLARNKLDRKDRLRELRRQTELVNARTADPAPGDRHTFARGGRRCRGGPFGRPDPAPGLPLPERDLASDLQRHPRSEHG